MLRKRWQSLAVLWVTSAYSASALAQVSSSPVGAETQRLLQWMAAATADYRQRVFPSGGWEDASDEAAAAAAARVESRLAELRANFDPDALDVDGLIEYRLYEHEAERSLREHGVRELAFVFSPIAGPLQGVAALIGGTPGTPPSVQPEGPQIAEAFVARIETVDDYLDALRVEFEERAAEGVVPPRWALEQMIEQTRNALRGAPFDEGPPSAMLAGVSRRLERAYDDERLQGALLDRARAGLIEDLAPAYRRLIVTFERLRAEAPDVYGMWAPGAASPYYDHLIASATTIGRTAEGVRTIGTRELARIHAEIEEVMTDVGFTGTIGELFDFLRTDDRFYYSNTSEGRAAYLADADRIIEEMTGRLDDVLAESPDLAPLTVARLAPFQESEAASAMYLPASPFASSPGFASGAPSAAYLVNLSDMRAAPKYLLQPMAYHEGVPGHHLQFSIQRALAVPAVSGTTARERSVFRLPRAFAAFTEGWAFYAEQLPYELGLYVDPYANIGRLGMEAWRAARLVVDVGIHVDGWTREQAVGFLLANTPLTEAQARIEADRYARGPGWATAYLIGRLEIEALRARAEAALAADFDLRAFHSELLRHGSLPLSVLGEVIERWIGEIAQH